VDVRRDVAAPQLDDGDRLVRAGPVGTLGN
jgi:hypothetical protein